MLNIYVQNELVIHKTFIIEMKNQQLENAVLEREGVNSHLECGRFWCHSVASIYYDCINVRCTLTSQTLSDYLILFKYRFELIIGI